MRYHLFLDFIGKVVKKSFENGRQVLVKVVLFQLKGCGHPQDDAMSNFFPNSKSLILGLLNEISFVSRFYYKGR